MVTKKSLFSVLLLNTIFFVVNVYGDGGGGGGGGGKSGSVDDDDYIEDFSINSHEKTEHAILSNNKVANNITHHLNKDDFIKQKSTISLEFFDDALRQGLQPFYIISNYIIDEVIKPDIPKSLLENNSGNNSIMNYVKKTVQNFMINDIKSYWTGTNEIRKIYGSLLGLTIGCIVLALLITLIGIIIFFHRCCCKKKSNPFDSKTDSIKRKINAFFLFLFLLVALLATIILFFSNQNSDLAAQTAPNVFTDGVVNINNYLSNDIPVFLNKSSKQIDIMHSNVSKLFDGNTKRSLDLSSSLKNIKLIISLKKDSIGHFLANLLKTVKPFEKILSEFNETLVPKLKTLDVSFTNVFSEEKIIFNLINNHKKVENQNEELNLNELEKILHELRDGVEFFKNIQPFFNKSTSELTFENILTNMDSNIWKEEKATLLKKVDSQLKSLHDILQNLNTPIESFISELKPYEKFNQNPTVKIYLNYYKYFYYGIMGVSAFMLFLFVMYAFGLAGMCARRKHENFKQTCHRGTSANFLLASSGFYFLFTWLLVLICIAFYLPGITVRQFGCKPALQLEDNNIFQLIKHQPEIQNLFSVKFGLNINDFKIKDLLIDCKETNHSEQLTNLFKKIVKNKNTFSDDILETESLTQLLSQKIKDLNFLDEFKKIEKFLKIFKADSGLKARTETWLKDISSFKTLGTAVQAITATTESNDDAESKKNFSLILEELAKIEKFLQDLKEFIGDENQKVINNLIAQLESLKEIDEKDKLKTEIESNLKKTFNEFTKPKFDEILAERTNTLANMLPSCRILHSIYEKFLVTGCLHFIDNFNTYWVTLLFLIVLHFIIVLLALNQADLFRKSYAYDELLADNDATDEYKEFQANNPNGEQYEVFRTKTSTNAPIDAYEMHGYTKNNPNMIKTRATPPPNYKVTRA